LQAIDRNAVTGLEQPIGGGKRVVEDRIVGEVAHGEVVDPANGAWAPSTGCVDALNGNAPREHASTLMHRDAG
jgi:hypothetical protein